MSNQSKSEEISVFMSASGSPSRSVEFRKSQSLSGVQPPLLTYEVLPSPAVSMSNLFDQKVFGGWQDRELAGDLIDLAYQYRSDLRYPPVGGSLERRLERIEVVLSKVEARAALAQARGGV